MTNNTISNEAGSKLTPVFVVGTGRCGSTLLSDIFNRHPDILSLAGLFDDRLLTVRYEELLARPREVLERLFRFMLCGDPGIDLDACAAMVHAPRSAWQQIGAAEAEALGEACRPGFELLASQLPGMAWN